MADTVSWSKETVMGDVRVLMGTITGGGGAVATGLDWIYTGLIAQAASQNTGDVKTLLFNTDASGAGDVQLASSTTGDDAYIVIYGK
jgi:hypothetical protein